MSIFLQFTISCPQCAARLCFPCTAAAIRCTCIASDDSATTIVTAPADSRCPRAILDQWAHLRAGRLRAMDTPPSLTSLRAETTSPTAAALDFDDIISSSSSGSRHSNSTEDSISSPLLPLLFSMCGQSADSRKFCGVPAAFCIPTLLDDALRQSSSVPNIVRRSFASWWAPAALALPLDANAASGATLSATATSATSFAADTCRRAHGNEEMSDVGNHYQPPHSKRRNQHHGIERTESRAFISTASVSGSSNGSLHLTLLDDDGIDTVFRMGTSASFEQVAVAYAGLVGAQPHRVQLWHLGARIRHSQTPAEVRVFMQYRLMLKLYQT